MAPRNDARSLMRKELGKKTADALLAKLDRLAKAGASPTMIDKALSDELEAEIVKSITPSLNRAIKATLNKAIKANINKSIRAGVRKAIKSSLPAIKSRTPAIKSRLSPAIKSQPTH